MIEEIKELIPDLTYYSEVDSGFDLLEYEADPTLDLRENVLRALGAEPAAAVAEVSLDQFFAPMIEEKSSHSQTQAKQRANFARLRDIFKEAPKQSAVFKVGEIEIDIVVVAQLPNGKLILLKTSAVET